MKANIAMTIKAKYQTKVSAKIYFNSNRWLFGALKAIESYFQSKVVRGLRGH